MNFINEEEINKEIKKLQKELDRIKKETSELEKQYEGGTISDEELAGRSILLSMASVETMQKVAESYKTVATPQQPFTPIPIPLETSPPKPGEEKPKLIKPRKSRKRAKEPKEKEAISKKTIDIKIILMVLILAIILLGLLFILK